jgi:CelD/BcsL family acetyltransferase involved in cellulose biosynthesis
MALNRMRLHTNWGVDRLQAIVEEWRDLLPRCGQDEPTLAPEWVLPWWDVFGRHDERRLCVAELRTNGRLVGLAPLVTRRRRHRRVVPLRRLELVCCGEPWQDEVLSEYVGVLAERDCEPEVARALVDALDAGAFGALDEFGIPAMSSDDPLAAVLETELKRRGWRTALTPADDSPFAVLPSTFDAYLASLPARRRHSIRRAERDLAAWAGETLAVHVARDAAGLAEGQQILARLHGERWQAAGHGGAFRSSLFSQFHQQAMPQLLERGMLELLWLEAHGEPVAVLYNLLWKNKVYNYQSGRRMDLPAGLRPGLAVHVAAIRRAVEHGRREYDFLGGAARYKLDFSTGTRQLLALEAARPGVRDVARRAVDHLASAVLRRHPVAAARTPSAPAPASGG